MKISLEWLSDFVTWTEKDPVKIANSITLGSAEVEEVEVQGSLLAHCCVGEILSVKKHPDADRLCIAEVKTDKGTKTVVCGGTNVKEGMQVAFAHTGATVKWHGGDLMELKPVKIRGIASEGMICAAEELGLGSLFPPKPEDGERAVIDLSSRTLKTGAHLREALGLNDTILHINNTAITVRPDLFSHIGFARECVALGLAKWKAKPTYKLPKMGSGKIPFKMHVDAKGLVSRYLACSISVESTGATPDWMRRRLEATGWRCVSLPVDITNYVLMETGMPLHSFDADDIKGDVRLRLSKKGEQIITLDGVKRSLPEGALVLNDDEGIFDLIGIMGGMRSSTKESTRNIYLHAAALDSVTIRKAIIGTGHRTDASTVYEKGVQPITAQQGFARALELLLELAPKAKAASSLDDWGDNGKPKPIAITVEEIQKTLGIAISEKEILKTLSDLEFDVKKKPKGALSVTAPLHRLRDVSIAEDVIEEVGRIHDYNLLPETPAAALMRIPQREVRGHQLRDALKAKGYCETVPLSFTNEQLLTKCGLNPNDAVAIENPLGEETALLQTHVFPQLLEHARHNLAHARGELRTFRTGRVFSKTAPEHVQLGLLRAAKAETGLMDDPFLHAKEDLLNAIRSLGYDANIAPAKQLLACMHPGRSAHIMLQGKVIGQVFEVHPSVRARFDLPHRAAIAFADLTALFAIKTPIRFAKSLPSFPAVTYDETINRTHTDPIGPLLEKLQKGHDLLETVAVQDLYEKKHSGGSYNATLRFTYRAPDRTLTENEVKDAHAKVMGMVK